MSGAVEKKAKATRVVADGADYLKTSDDEVDVTPQQAESTFGMPMLSIPKRVLLFVLMGLSFPASFAGTWHRTESPLPECFLEFPPQNCIFPKADYDPTIYASFVLLGVVFFSLFLAFPYVFPSTDAGEDGFFQHFTKRLYSNKKKKTNKGTFPIWGYLGAAVWFSAWYAHWVQPAALTSILPYMFIPLWTGFIFTQDAVVFYRTGGSLFHDNAAALFHMALVSGFGWLYFEFMGYFTQNWYYPINKIFSTNGYILWYTLCYMTIFPSVFQWAEILASFKHFRTAYSNGPKLTLPRWFIMGVFAISCYGCYAMAVNPKYSLWMCFEWLAPMLFSGLGLSLVGIPNPWTQIASGDWGPIVIYGLAGFINGFCWEGWNYWSAPSNPSFWKYDIPFLNAFYIFEMPSVGFLGYLPFGICCWTMWLMALAIVNPPQPLTWKNSYVWLILGATFYVLTFKLGYVLTDIYQPIAYAAWSAVNVGAVGA